MSNVDLSIGGKSFRVACDEGEEARVAGLGRLIDSKVQSLGLHGQNEGRMLLFASLMLADELHEAQNGTGAPVQAPAPDAGALAARLEAVAAALEKCASALEG